MLISTNDVEKSKRILKGLKKKNGRLVDPNLKLYENNVNVTPQIKVTNENTLQKIEELMVDSNKKNADNKPSPRIITFDERLLNPDKSTLLDRYDYNLNQNIYFPINNDLSFHLNAILYTKNQVGFYHLHPTFSYKYQDWNADIGFRTGTNTDYHFLIGRNLSELCNAGIYYNFMFPAGKIDKQQILFYIRYSWIQAYAGFGTRGLWGFKIQKLIFNKFSIYLNPYYGIHTRGISFGFMHKFSEFSTMKVEVNITDFIKKLRLACEYKIKKFFKIFLSFELAMRDFFLSFGLNYKKFSFTMPIFGLPYSSTNLYLFIPAILAMFIAGLSWKSIRRKLMRETSKPLISTFDQKLEKRQTELKLIYNKARNSLIEEQNKNGLVIEEAYYGTPYLIHQLDSITSKESLTQRLDLSLKLIDVTDPLRYYVEDSKLTLPKYSKKHLYGFFELDLNKDDVPYLYIRYTYNNKQYVRKFEDKEAVRLP